MCEKEFAAASPAESEPDHCSQPGSTKAREAGHRSRRTSGETQEFAGRITERKGGKPKGPDARRSGAQRGAEPFNYNRPDVRKRATGSTTGTASRLKIQRATANPNAA